MCISEYLHVCIHKCLHAECPLKPEEGIGSWETGVAGHCETMWVLETESASPVRTVSVINYEPPLQPPAYLFLIHLFSVAESKFQKIILTCVLLEVYFFLKRY